MKTRIILGTLVGSLICGAAFSENSPRIHSTVPTEQHPSSIAITPSGKFAYVANEGSDSISVFTVNQETGWLSAQSTTPLDGAGDPAYLTVSPKGRYLYAATWGDYPVIVVYRINPDSGSLVVSQQVKLEINATYIAIDPAEKFAYVAHYFGVSVFGMDSRTGKLDLRKTIKTQGECPYSIGMDPHGKFVFVTNGNGASPTNGPGLVSAFGVNSKTGLLTAKGSADAEINPDKIVVHPTGKFVYVVNENSGTVSMFAVNQANGTMASLGATGAKGHRRVIAIHPSGRFVYVPEGSSVFSHVLSSGELRSDINGSNAVSIFSVNQETGALVAKGEVGAGEEVKPGSTPSSVVVHPNGKFLYVTNSESNNVSIYAINPETGALTIPGG